MDRFAEQLFGQSDKDASKSPRSGGGGDTKGLAQEMLMTFATSAYQQAMSRNQGEASRGIGGGGGGGFDVDDFRALGGMVMQMMNGKGDKDERRRKKEEKRRQREKEKQKKEKEKEKEMQREWDKERERKKKEKEKKEKEKKEKEKKGKEKQRQKDRGLEADTKSGWSFNTGAPYVPKYTKARRRLSRSPLHVKFADPLEHHNYPRPFYYRSRRHSRRGDDEAAEEDDYDRDARRRRRRRRREREREKRSNRHGPAINFQGLKAELENMLDKGSANYQDDQFYDKFLGKGGALQDLIGNTLGQIRGWEERGGEGSYGYGQRDRRDNERRDRKRRRRERERNGESQWWIL
ncbi:hypothetical protein BGZ63DRAFT_393276 [Mariannaea sp. PMI_226]|nr:hypothetical protein BGZ63DRAFT_393276 [Mariannaea sp. PMI_226]